MQQAWSQFACRLEDFSHPQHLSSALACLNLLVTDALRHVPDVVAYLSRLRNQSVFNFCAIPQVGLLYCRTPDLIQLLWYFVNWKELGLNMTIKTIGFFH